MSVVDLEIGEGLPLIRNQVYLRTVRIHAQASKTFKENMDKFSLEENARYLDSLTSLKRAIEHASIWREQNKELILAQYN